MDSDSCFIEAYSYLQRHAQPEVLSLGACDHRTSDIATGLQKREVPARSAQRAQDIARTRASAVDFSGASQKQVVPGIHLSGHFLGTKVERKRNGFRTNLIRNHDFTHTGCSTLNENWTKLERNLSQLDRAWPFMSMRDPAGAPDAGCMVRNDQSISNSYI